MQHTIISTRAVLALVSAGLALTVPTQAANLLVNGNFANNVYNGTVNFQDYSPTLGIASIANWSWSPTVGPIYAGAVRLILDNVNAGDIPDGSTYAVSLEGATSWIKQSVTLNPGQYQLRFDAAATLTQYIPANPIYASFDGVNLSFNGSTDAFTPTLNWVRYTSDVFTVTTAGTYELKIAANNLAGGYSGSSAVANVNLSAFPTVVPVPAIPATLTEYYQNQPVEGVPQPQTSFALGTDWALTLSPDSLYAQNAGGNYGTSYRTLYGDGNHLLFKFNRQPGDTNAYDVTVNLSGYNQPSSDGTPPIIRLLWGTDAFGDADQPNGNHGGIWWQGNSANLTQVASSTAAGSFTWDSGNVSTFHIGEDQQSAYLMVLGSASSYAYVYSASADFTAIPTGYAPWADTNAGGQTIDLDYDNDGVSNGVEYFMNAAPGFTANPGFVGNTVTWTNGGNISASTYGTQFIVQTSSDLVTWDDVAEGDLNSNTNGPAGSLSYSVDPANGPAKQFVRLKVTPN